MIKLQYLKDRSIVKIKKSNFLKNEGRIRLSKVRITGSNNTLVIESGARINRSKFYIKGKNNIVVIGKDCDLNDLEIIMENYGGTIRIGEKTTCEKTKIVSLEPYDILIGKDCMISYDVEIRNTDSHKMFSVKHNNWINKGKKVEIDDHVWIGTRALILKGSKIARNCVVGAGTIVSKRIEEENSVIVGTPGRIVDNDIYWNRDRVFEDYK